MSQRFVFNSRSWNEKKTFHKDVSCDEAQLGVYENCQFKTFQSKAGLNYIVKLFEKSILSRRCSRNFFATKSILNMNLIDCSCGNSVLIEISSTINKAKTWSELVNCTFAPMTVVLQPQSILLLLSFEYFNYEWWRSMVVFCLPLSCLISGLQR